VPPGYFMRLAFAEGEQGGSVTYDPAFAAA